MSSKDSIKWIYDQFKDTNELIEKNMEYDNKHLLLFYIKSLIDMDMLEKFVIKPFFEMSSEEQLNLYLHALPQFQEITSKEQVQLEVMKGNTLIVIQNEYYLLDFRLSKNDEVNQTSIETTIHGSQLAFSDNLATNINIIRTNYHQPSLTVEYIVEGEVNQHKVAIIYDKDKVKTNVLDTIREKLQKVDKQLISSTTQLNNYINDKPITIFPQMIMTERPDRIIYNLAGGKVILFVDGNPQAVATPAVFFDFMTTMEDNYHTFVISLFLRILRYAGLFLSLLLPAVYVGVTSFTPEVFRTELALTVAGSRVGVPFSSFIEVLFMLFFMELLLEASIRLPKAVSATATTVGGLILGTAVTEASLASNIMVIIVSAVAISTFVIPVNEMAFSIRVVRLLLILITSVFGLAGLVLGFFVLLMYLVNMDSFGEPYLRIYAFSKNKKSSEEKT
ncbi:spore germination protein [Ureibacillus chungkukjangi]|uniref:Spore germination protein n=1 Tax=Ureibacillus chungkukjangi TaxID=1202712 RepID=A0A318TQ95_9BACL|nr:spore germination protein [Ureibacillus chungkukjangi]PYF06077.1 spore germination protein [Ureibacillus chungkukjangi]